MIVVLGLIVGELSDRSDRSDLSDWSDWSDGLRLGPSEAVGDGGEEALADQMLMVSIAIVGKGMDGYASARSEYALDLNVARIHEGYKILHDDVDAILMKVAVVAEAEEIEFQALALDHFLTRDI